MAEERIFLYHPDKLERGRLAHFLESSGYTLSKFAKIKELNDELKLRTPHLVILAPDTKEYKVEQAIGEIKGSTEYLPILLICPAAESEAEKIFNQSGADSFITQPVRKSNILPVVRLLIQNRNITMELATLKDEIGKLKVFLNRAQGSEPVTNFYTFEFFKKILSIELKRAQRFNFPLSIMICTIDGYEKLSRTLNESEINSLILNISVLIRQNIRDIDIPVYYREAYIMIVMPHTGLDGAVSLAERLRAKVAGYKSENERIRRVTLSIGVAESGESKNISFHDMCKGALSSLERAVSSGGNRVCIPEPRS